MCGLGNLQQLQARDDRKCGKEQAQPFNNSFIACNVHKNMIISVQQHSNTLLISKNGYKRTMHLFSCSKVYELCINITVDVFIPLIKAIVYIRR